MDREEFSSRRVGASDPMHSILCEGMPVAYNSLDAGGRILYVNREWCILFGYSAEYVVGRRFDEFLPSNSCEEFETIFETFKREGTARGVEFSVRCRSGAVKIVSFSGKIEYDGGGDVWCAHIFLNDITNREGIIDELRKSEDRFRTLSESAPIGIFLTDAEGRTEYINRRLEEISGLSAEESMDYGWGRIIHPQDRDEIMRRAKTSVRERKEFSATIRIVSPGGAVRRLNVRSAPLIFREGEQFARVGTVEDITEKRLAENALRESEWKYRSIMDAVKFGVAVIDRRMRVISVNRQMMKWFPALDASKRPVCYEAFNDPPRTDACPHCPMISTLRDEKMHEAVCRMYRGGEIRSYRIVSSPLRDERGDVIAVIESLEDITDRLKMEGELLKNEKLKSLSVLARGVAHDYNNILASLVGNISLIKERVGHEPAVSELVDEVELAAVRARRLTRQLDSFSKDEPPVKKTVEIGYVIRESAEFALHGSACSCVYDLPGDLPPVEIDIDQIDQAIGNIVLNAVQALADGGTIRIAAARAEISDTSTLDILPGTYVRITVEDGGPGIAEEYIPRVFEPFFTTKEKGTGLGLALCRTILKNHGGDIIIESGAGVGTKVSLYLPAACKTLSGAETGADAGIARRGRILVLDDDRSMRRMMDRIIDEFGYEAECAERGEEAVRLYSEAMQSGNRFSAVILDLTIRGGLGGSKILDRLREIDPGVRAVVTSGYPDHPVMAKSERYGFLGVLSKPYRIEELKETLRRVVDSDS